MVRFAALHGSLQIDWDFIILLQVKCSADTNLSPLSSSSDPFQMFLDGEKERQSDDRNTMEGIEFVAVFIHR